MIVYGLVAYLGYVALTIGYFVVKRSGDADQSENGNYKEFTE